ncbi:hypothetical protein IP88_07340 [alpha proteobacterium AAP81b]|nr:hypothetical protein IP88_07340 [alpha proteobacterium AAP81b]
MVAVVGMEAAAQWQLAPDTPFWVRAAAWAIVAALLLVFAWRIPAVIAATAAGDTARIDAHVHAVLAFGSYGTIGQVFLLFPWLDTEMRMIVVIFCVATAAIIAMSSIERLPPEMRADLTPAIIPIGVIAWYLLHPSWPHLLVAGVVALLSLIMLQLRARLLAQVDRTREALLEAETARARLLAEREAKSRFIASAWHDLGQPIQAARLFSDQARRSPSPAARATAARDADTAFAAVERQLREMLDHLRLEAGTIAPAIATLAAGPLIADAAALHAAAARHAGVRLRALPSRLLLRGDGYLAARALSNLIDNALRHAGARRVLVAARRRQATIELWVIDDGIGIAPALAPTLFDDFTQGAATVAGGFGLGLGSARRCARLLGGELTLSLRWCGGAAFCLALPAA